MSNIPNDEINVREESINRYFDNSGFVPLTDVVPDALLEIRYYSTLNFVGERI